MLTAQRTLYLLLVTNLADHYNRSVIKSVYVCDRICEKVHNSHIQFFNFDDLQNLGMLDRFETFRDCRTTIPLSSLKISYLHTIHCGFYRSPNTQNQMYELCIFSQIWSHTVETMYLRCPLHLSAVHNGLVFHYFLVGLVGKLLHVFYSSYSSYSCLPGLLL